MKFHHVGIATESIEEALAYVKKHFDVSEVSETVFDPNQNAYLCMVTMKDGMQMELISGEVVKSFVKKKQYLYHTCYEVKDIEQQIAKFEEDSFVMSEPKEAILFHGKRVVFITTQIGLIELVEE